LRVMTMTIIGGGGHSITLMRMRRYLKSRRLGSWSKVRASRRKMTSLG